MKQPAVDYCAGLAAVHETASGGLLCGLAAVHETASGGLIIVNED